MQWDDVVKKAASAKKKGAWHVDMVNILWIKRKNHLHFAMQMAKSVEVAGFEPAAFWSRSASASLTRSWCIHECLCARHR
jgi:hypothetical protein